MTANKSRAFPIVITCILIVIIIYLFASVEQPYVTCSKSITDETEIRIVEEVSIEIDGNKIDEMNLTKTIVLPEKYTKEDTYLNSLKFLLENHYEYLGDDVNYIISDDRISVMVDVDDDSDTLIFNNIEFIENEDLEIKINSNTRSSDVVTLSIGDKYTEGELMIRMKNNGYSCN